MGYRDKLSYGRKRRPGFNINPRIIIVILVIIFLFLCLIGRGTFTRIGCSSDQSVVYKNYVSEAKELTDKSNKLGQDFAALRVSIKDLKRKDLENQLNMFITESKKISNSAADIEVPEGLETANLYLQISLDLRTAAFTQLKPAIINAIGDKDLEVSAKSVSLAMKDLALADRTFIIFHDKTVTFLQENKVAGITVPTSVYLPAGDEYEMATVLEFLQGIKGSGNLTQLHGVSITEMTIDPAAKSEIDGIALLPSGIVVSVTVTVENQGNQVEINIPVEVTLKSETQPQPQKKKKSIGSISPGQRKAVTITDLKPTQGDIVNLLTVTVGPVPNEKFIDNNTLEYKFTMERE